MRTILVTGGAGYVGSQSVVHFRRLGWRAVTFDDFSTGHRDLASQANRVIEGSVQSEAALSAALSSELFDGVLHCASRSLVPESVDKPLAYFEQNIGGAVALARACIAAGGVPIVFSSSAAVYGQPAVSPIPEDVPKAPCNPYGFSKLAVEELLRATSRSDGLKSVCLRYFNAAGADPEGLVGERHAPETHLIPNMIKATLEGGAKTFKLMGTDYPTRDGTCLRDFIHTLDIARAHQLAFEYLWDDGETASFNIGSETGATVREMVEAASRVLGATVPSVDAPRRQGDPATLLADASRARATLGFRPQYSDIETILTHAVAWHRHDAHRDR